MYKPYFILALTVVLGSCGTPRQQDAADEEDHEAKSLLQGIWLDDDTDTPLLQVKGDSIYYADAAVAPVAFQVKGDSLVTYGAQTNEYRIEKRGEYTFWFQSAMGNTIRLHKAEDESDSLAFRAPEPVPVYTDVIKKDSIVTYNNIRYRGYVYINPSRIRVMRPGVTEEGLGVDNVYYDNIIHICIYQGKESLYSKDIRKHMFEGIVPDDFLQWAILSDMDFCGVDASGYHYQATVCIPDGASCYMVHITVSKDGNLSYQLME